MRDQHRDNGKHPGDPAFTWWCLSCGEQDGCICVHHGDDEHLPGAPCQLCDEDAERLSAIADQAMRGLADAAISTAPKEMRR